MSKKVKICPNCGSEKIDKDRSKWLNSLGLDNMHICEDCNYEGRFFLIIDKEKVGEAKEVISENVDSEKLLNQIEDDSINKWRLSVGVLFVIMSIAPLIYSEHSGNLLVGVISLLIGFILIRDEVAKLN